VAALSKAEECAAGAIDATIVGNKEAVMSEPRDRKSREADDSAVENNDRENEKRKPNPPRTTTGKWFTAPKFGSAGSGGAELEPGPEED
jgi:hypothetical protein